MHGRGLRELFEAIAFVDRADLVVAGFGADYERYRSLAVSLPHAERTTSSGRSRQPRSRWTAGADVAAMPVQPDTLNHRLNTPTKL